MPRVTICIETDDRARQAEVESWLLRWHEVLGNSENNGCGCCVDMYNLNAPWDAIHELPEEYFAYSDWAEWPSLDLQRNVQDQIN